MQVLNRVPFSLLRLQTLASPMDLVRYMLPSIAANRPSYGLTKLHLVCGDVRMEGFVNIDVVHTKATDLVKDISELEFPDASVERITSYHFLEHLYREQALELLEKTYRWLCPGGFLILELPDIKKVSLKVAFGRCGDRNLWGIYGAPSTHKSVHDVHRWGWCRASMSREFARIGFSKIVYRRPRDPHYGSGHACRGHYVSPMDAPKCDHGAGPR